MTDVYSLRHLEVSLSDNFTLRVPELSITRGTVRCLTGPNGAGKSTLLKVLALLTMPQQGELTLFGQPLGAPGADLSALRRRVTLVDQSPYLLQGSIGKNLLFGLKVRKIKEEEQERRIAEALKAVHLTFPLETPVAHLSGGEKQRVALARALVLQPEVLLLDEPTANIDRSSVPHFEQLLQNLAKNGTTVILSTHNPEQAQRFKSGTIQVTHGQVSEA